MDEIRGSEHRILITDFSQKCKICGRLFYFNHDCNGKKVICPYCGCRH